MDHRTHITKDEKKRYWQTHVDNWKESTLTQKKYCADKNISYWNFKTRYAKLKTEGGAVTKRFIKIPPKQIMNTNPGKIEILIRGTVPITVEENISAQNLHKIFESIGICS